MLQAAQRADGRWTGSESIEMLRALRPHPLTNRIHLRTILRLICKISPLDVALVLEIIISPLYSVGRFSAYEYTLMKIDLPCIYFLKKPLVIRLYTLLLLIMLSYSM
jgi:hypothetical protein